ncbi:preprotein translocase subunit SecD [Dermatophilus congolensis]|uniref:Protein translocase subunit SecD n=1 Tax=Dermatophilus congolensis TaxID=1863 RepID=A0AA46H095_9MICO|nr:protein translocase subunit SecD [Dermatophilus congolensis]STD08411.1 preprotein translocase subunit SecD [Dermatophilus congolensis]
MASEGSNVGVESGARRPNTRPAHKRATSDLVICTFISLGLVVLLALSATMWGGQWAPKLGLDLEGGTQMILQPQTQNGQTVDQQQLDQAVDIIRARVDGQGVAEAEVSTLGNNVVVSVPGRMAKQQEDGLRASSQMAFRPVLGMIPVQPPGATPSPTQSPAPSGSASSPPAAKPGTTPAPSGSPSAAATPSASTPAGRPKAAAAPAPAPKPTTPAPTTPAPTGSASPTAAPTGKPTGAPAAKPTAPAAPPTITADVRKDPTKLIEAATSEGWLTPELQGELKQINCQKQDVTKRPDPNKATVACASDGQSLYVLGPTVMDGNNIADASSGMATNPQTGQPTGGYEVQLKTHDDYVQAYATISGYMVKLGQPRNQLAAVLDNRVISAPYFSSAITGGQASISGNFTADQAKLLADQLKFGALPMSFEVQSTDNVSPTVGGDQLRNGLLAGLLGLILVFVYFLWQYRVTGLVVVSSVLLVAALTYIILTLLGWGYNLRLTMAGVTGAIVAIGTTADSFIVYFERVRDEAREGKRLAAAVESGWIRARRTILISDSVNLIAAVVLYLLAAANVRGFAFMLIVTTLLDLFVTFLFTHPLLTLLARTKFFSSGHKLSGFDPKTLGTGAGYKGAGRFVPGPTAGAARPTGGSHA